MSWDAVAITRDERTKPVFLMPDGSEPLIFNVSHQAGLVVMLAVLNPPSREGEQAAAAAAEGEAVGASGKGDRGESESESESGAGAGAGAGVGAGAGKTRAGGRGFAIGVDIVCPTERRERDYDMIEGEGWPNFIDVHDEVFSRGEVLALKRLRLVDKNTKLAYFYALWCLREAYVKMTGEALLAKWLRRLDMQGFAPPGREGDEGQGHGQGQGRGQGLQLFVDGEKIEDVEMVLEPLLEEYMVGACVRRAVDGTTVQLGKWNSLDINEVLTAAEAARS